MTKEDSQTPSQYRAYYEGDGKPVGLVYGDRGEHSPLSPSCARVLENHRLPHRLGEGRSLWCLKASLGLLLLVLFRSGDRVKEGPGNEVELSLRVYVE